MKSKSYKLPIIVFLSAFTLLAFVQLKVERLMILAGCHHNSINYRFLKMDPDKARNLYLILTISLHAACIALARI
jgi:hypothetical protein